MTETPSEYFFSRIKLFLFQVCSGDFKGGFLGSFWSEPHVDFTGGLRAPLDTLSRSIGLKWPLVGSESLILLKPSLFFNAQQLTFIWLEVAETFWGCFYHPRECSLWIWDSLNIVCFWHGTRTFTAIASTVVVRKISKRLVGIKEGYGNTIMIFLGRKKVLCDVEVKNVICNLLQSALKGQKMFWLVLFFQERFRRAK